MMMKTEIVTVSSVVGQSSSSFSPACVVLNVIVSPFDLLVYFTPSAQSLSSGRNILFIPVGHRQDSTEKQINEALSYAFRSDFYCQETQRRWKLQPNPSKCYSESVTREKTPKLLK